VPIVPSRKLSADNPGTALDITAALLLLAQIKTESSGVSGRGAIVEQHQGLKRLLEE